MDNPPPTEPATKGHQNRLARERSPYLLQHASNPVDWYPWGEEAFALARRLNRPIFLSIGYSTCHWCHVMERESFEDPEVARLLNETFVCIKVDREERPDIDAVYMTVCQMMTGSGGWPLTLLLTPDRRPFFAATYIPRTSRFGHAGLLELLPQVRELWATRQAEVLATAGRVASALRQTGDRAPGEELGAATLRRAYDQLAARFDAGHGGFGDAPKFPTPHNLSFLLRYRQRTGTAHALAMVERTLRAMRLGGIYDHVGFGFHRYSTDARWLVPHFEKMLYDQALLVIAYVEAYLATGNAEYAQTARETLTYVLRDLASPDGGFYSAEDADSEGEEGRFYLWTLDEVRQVLGADDAALAAQVFSLAAEGNWVDPATRHRPGTNILHLRMPLAELAAGLEMEERDAGASRTLRSHGGPSEREDLLRQRVEAIRQRLFAARQRRVRPHRDDKILADWNGLMIAALALAARALDEPAYAAAAQRAADFLLRTLRRPDGRLLHRFRDGEAAIPAHADDYAFLIWGLTELYQATFEVHHLQAALDLNRDLLRHFCDERGGGFYFTADDAEELLVRQKDIYDGAVPSANSVAMLNLLRLARITGDASLEERAARIGRAFASDVQQAPMAYTQLMIALEFAVGPSREIVIAGRPQGDDTRGMLRALRARFLPNAVVLLRPTDVAEPEIIRVAPFTRGQVATRSQATAYVCQGGSCNRPTTSIAEMLESLAPTPPSREP